MSGDSDDVIILSSDSAKETSSSSVRSSAQKRKKKTIRPTMVAGPSSFKRKYESDSDSNESLEKKFKISPSQVPSADATPGLNENGSGAANGNGEEADLHDTASSKVEVPGPSKKSMKVLAFDQPDFKAEWDNVAKKLQNLMKSEEYEKLVRNLRKVIDQLKFNNNKVLRYGIELLRKSFVDVAEGNCWKTLMTFRERMDNLVKKQGDIIKADEEKRAIANGGEELAKLKAKNLKRIQDLEKVMNNIDRQIKKYEEMEDNPEEEEINSPYMIVDRLQQRFVKYYEEWCGIKKISSSGLRRPIHRHIVLKGVTMYEPLNKAAEAFINGQGTWFMPDFPEVQKIVNGKAKQLDFTPELCHSLAVKLFERIVQEIKEKRGDDLKEIAFSHLLIPEPETEPDKDLESKLAENKKLEKSVDEVLGEFVKLQEEQRLEPEEVPDEVANESNPESDDEESESGGSIDDNQGSDESKLLPPECVTISTSDEED